jgi:hypothetical protein
MRLTQLSFVLVFLFKSLAILNAHQYLPPPVDDKCVSGKYPPDKSTVVPTYIVNLDLAPELRWKEIATEYAKPVIKSHTTHTHRLEIFFLEIIKSISFFLSLFSFKRSFHTLNHSFWSLVPRHKL